MQEYSAENLFLLSDEEIRSAVSNKNSAGPYLPFNTKSNKLDWDAVVGFFLGSLLGKDLKKYSFEQFLDDTRSHFLQQLDDHNAWGFIEVAYFNNHDLMRISPEFLIFNTRSQRRTSAEARVADFFIMLLEGKKYEFQHNDLNFIEQELCNILTSNLQSINCEKDERLSYLPFLSELFKTDVEWLLTHPKYFLSEIKNFLTLYGFLYAAQVGLNLKTEWKQNSYLPECKPLYFLLETEKASSERASVEALGYKSFRSTAERIFPLLSLSEEFRLEREPSCPLWRQAELFQQSSQNELALQFFKSFGREYCKKRDLDPEKAEQTFESCKDARICFSSITSLAVEQFIDRRSSRHGISSKYVNTIERYFGGPFIQPRGRAGNVLILNQDLILFLTNLSIGTRTKLRFYEVMREFRSRGVWLDSQSEQELIAFYDRVGNVERLSDSGDAVYVRKTV